MISTKMAQNIMGLMFGIDSVTYVKGSNGTVYASPSNLQSPKMIYIGMSALEPNKDSGEIPENGEPIAADGTGKFGYKRQPVGGSGAIPGTVSGSGVANGATGSGNTANMTRVFRHAENSTGNVKYPGVIENKDEIQFNTATSDYDKVMKYWFLSDSETNGAFIWGQIKDILWPQSTNNIIVQDIVCDKTEDSNAYPVGSGLTGLNGKAYFEADPLSDPFVMTKTEDNNYIVTWGDQDYTVRPRIYQEKDEHGKVVKQYMHLGNAEADGQTMFSNDASPFFIRYNIERGDDEDFVADEIKVQSTNRGLLKVYSFDSNDYLDTTKPEDRKHTFGLYGEGIKIPVATVPTFYPTQLRASLDVAL